MVGRKGSHIRLNRRRNKELLIAVVPMHRELARGTLRSILRQANLTFEDLLRLS
ncbi:MAG: type II toxin-antitoxin system HicA family toxin [Candidatus Bathyarchaeia archaeon]